jgi:DNA-binding HxlR family transcriptional regulator
MDTNYLNLITVLGLLITGKKKSLIPLMFHIPMVIPKVLTTKLKLLKEMHLV